jgi:hypothetical protein
MLALSIQHHPFSKSPGHFVPNPKWLKTLTAGGLGESPFLVSSPCALNIKGAELNGAQFLAKNFAPFLG